jgi:hypothetical protein
MLDYADTHKLHVSEMPSTLGEQGYIVKKYGDVLIRCEPVQIIREGDSAGIWRVTRVWAILGKSDDSRPILLGYVRFALDDLFAHMRPGMWYNEEMMTRWDISASGGIVSGLRNACETLLLYRQVEMIDMSDSCGKVNPYNSARICTSLRGHELNEPAHVDEDGSVWYWEDYLLV